MNVVSLFDGISCAQIALTQLGLEDYRYFASEIDKNVIALTKHNFPDTIHVGGVENLRGDTLSSVDLVCGGSPCQSFSVGGKGKEFDDPRGKLVFEFIRIVKQCQPQYFLLENVKMSPKCADFISEQLGVKPILVNSNVVSAQSRERLYWTNISFDVNTWRVKSPMVKDILDETPDPSDIVSFQDVIAVERRLSKSLLLPWAGILTPAMYKKNRSFSKISDFPQGNRIYDSEHKTSTLMANSGGRGNKANLVYHNGVIRKFSRAERERLQTIPVGYTNSMKKSHAYTAIGNGWTVEVIKNIFKNMETFQ